MNAHDQRARHAPPSTSSGAAQLLEVGVLSSLGSIVSILPVVADAGRDPLGLRGALAAAWVAGMVLALFLFGAARLRATQKVPAPAPPGWVALVITIGSGLLGLAVGILQVLEPGVPGQSLNATAAGYVAVAASSLAIVLASAAFAGAARRTTWRLATKLAAAANLVLLLDGANILHARSPGTPLLVVSAAGGIVAIVAITYESTKRRSIDALAVDLTVDQTPR